MRQHFVRAYPAEVYGGLVAILFAAVGIALGRCWTQPREIVRVREVPVPAEPFVLDEETLRRVAITPRKLQILGLIAEGLSNREIGERLFVSENTVKTYASRLFDKLGEAACAGGAAGARSAPRTVREPAPVRSQRKDDFGPSGENHPKG